MKHTKRFLRSKRLLTWAPKALSRRLNIKTITGLDLLLPRCPQVVHYVTHEQFAALKDLSSAGITDAQRYARAAGLPYAPLGGVKIVIDEEKATMGPRLPYRLDAMGSRTGTIAGLDRSAGFPLPSAGTEA